MGAADRTPNREQQAVIDDLDRNIILFASAGTGKTFTVARRVQAVLASGRARPEEILCLTFTIRAADEMKNDILGYAGETAKDVTVRTIHSFAYQMLREEYVRKPDFFSVPAVCDETEAYEIACRVLEEMGLEKENPVLKNPVAVTGVTGALKQARELADLYGDDEAEDFRQAYLRLRAENPLRIRKLVTRWDYAEGREKADGPFAGLLEHRAGEFLHRYCAELRESSLLDFDDLICQTNRLMRDPDARAYWRGKYRYIVVDEMQDTSRLEYSMLRNLFPGNRVMMCGDFFQTIYQWRGSDPEKVLADYIREFGAVRYAFSRNYRSTRTLARASFGYLQRTWPGLAGRFCPAEVQIESTDPGEKILHVRAPDQDRAAEWIYETLLENRNAETAKMCVMCRTNGAIGNLYGRLQRLSAARNETERLRFFTVEKGVKLFRKPVIRDLMCFFRVLVNPTDSEAVRRLTERYVKNVGDIRIQRIREKGNLGISLVSYMDPDLYRCGDPYEPLLRAFRSGNVVVYDTETTGLDLEKDQAFQVSAIRLGPDGEPTETLDQMMIPTRPICAAAQATHHQTIETIRARGGVSLREGMENFRRFCDGAVLVGHNNLAFDSPLVRRMLRELGLPGMNIVREYDTLVLAHQLLPLSVNHKLGTLCEQFGIVNEAAHDALGDIRATGKLLSRFLTDRILPQTAARRAALEEFRPKFEKLFAFIQDLRTEYLEKNDVTGLARRAAETCKARAENRTEDSLFALDDLLYTVSQAETDDGPGFLLGLIRDAALSGSQIDLLLNKLKRIPIITVHQSKGCEFDTVIIADADDGSYPSYAAVQDGMEEEEKRLFYVAVSRAKKKLFLVSPRRNETKNGFQREKPPSRFIRNIPEDCIRQVTIR